MGWASPDRGALYEVFATSDSDVRRCGLKNSHGVMPQSGYLIYSILGSGKIRVSLTISKEINNRIVR